MFAVFSNTSNNVMKTLRLQNDLEKNGIKMLRLIRVTGAFRNYSNKGEAFVKTLNGTDCTRLPTSAQCCF